MRWVLAKESNTMYEAEVNNSKESIETLPVEIRKRFAEFRDQVASRTTLPWGEHCTECAWPTCYTTCDLYEAREDGACRQFAGSATRIDHREGLNPYVLKVRFKQWAKFWTVGNLDLKPLAQADRSELVNIAVGTIARNMPLPSFAKLKVLGKVNYLRRAAAENAKRNGNVPDCFLLECFNPNPRGIFLTFTLRLRERKEMRPFVENISVGPGYSRSTIAFGDISRIVDMSQSFELEIVPNDCADTTLYFGLMDFVRAPRVAEGAPAAKAEKAAAIKCVVWDLDNTLWDGVLIEDGPKKLKVRQGVVDLIRLTDQKGILHSIASKNNHDDAMAVLREQGLDEYFLYPQITWEPKSQSIANIAKLLNIGIDSLAFVDDQAFEREEVKSVLQQVTMVDAAAYHEILDRPECQMNATEESKGRRRMYSEQQQREVALEGYHGDYLAFLRDCQMEAKIQPLGEGNLKRVYEVAQRTNQMNFSGNRYKEERLREIMTSPDIESCVIECKDRFGDYGIVGFAVVEKDKSLLIDLMFSCRVQGKRVEHATLSYLLKRFGSEVKRDFYANYRKTAKNAVSGKVFDEMGFEQVSENDGVSLLVFPAMRPIPDDKVVSIMAEL